jgi:hypothetical protein
VLVNNRLALRLMDSVHGHKHSTRVLSPAAAIGRASTASRTTASPAVRANSLHHRLRSRSLKSQATRATKPTWIATTTTSSGGSCIGHHPKGAHFAEPVPGRHRSSGPGVRGSHPGRRLDAAELPSTKGRDAMTAQAPQRAQCPFCRRRAFPRLWSQQARQRSNAKRDRPTLAPQHLRAAGSRCLVR